MLRVLAFSFVALSSSLAQLPPPNSMGISMGHLHLTVSDVDAMKKFFVGVMGAEVVHAGRLEALKVPGAIIVLTKGTPGGGTDDSAVNHLGFLTPNLAEMKAKLTTAGGKVVREMPDTHQMFVMFPDGVKVEFTEQPDQKVPIVHHHIHFFTNDVEATRAWYVKHFGAVPGKRGRFEAADVPGVNLTFSPNPTATLPTKGRAVDHIGFEVKGLEAFCKKLEAGGIKFDTPYRYVPAINLGIAFLTDPFGVRVELTEGLNSL
ncbi:MAG TPA: VOC family protein [Bryobacteraceae bacterium]|nr:VOC family protein [Bryobacteraceae bacterium]